MPTNQNQYEQKLGFQTYADFSKSNKKDFMSERTKLKKIPIYIDTMDYETRVKTTKFLSEDKSLTQMEKFYEKLQENKQISNLKFVGKQDLAEMTASEFSKYRQALYLPYGFGYTLFTQTSSTRDYDYSINLPYSDLMKMIHSKKEKISAPIARYLIRVLTIFLSIGSALMTAWFFFSDLAASRLKTFRMANAKLKSQLSARILGIALPLIIVSFILTLPIFVILGKNILLDYWFGDYLIYYLLSVPISVFLSVIVSAILTTASNNVVFGMLASFSFVAASSRTSEIQEFFPFGLKWFKYIPSSSDFMWNAKIFAPYVEHQIVYLIVCGLLFMILTRIWQKKNVYGRLVKV